MTSVFLLDTSSFIYRAYHASKDRPTYTKDGTPNAAVFLFRTMIRRLQREYQPNHILAVCDTHAPTFRTKLYPAYKAQRLAPPEDLIKQLPAIRELLVQENVPIIEKAGYEADDLIGTLARRLQDEHLVVIVSGDKDMAQLVGGNVVFLNPSKTGPPIGPSGVEEVYGVRPDQIVDLMALRGDASDNVPGASGIGDKGALHIIKQFGTLERALGHSGEIAHAGWRRAVQNSFELIRLSKKLVTIVCDAPVVVPVCLCDEPNGLNENCTTCGGLL